jgi:hypothetical protein
MREDHHPADGDLQLPFMCSRTTVKFRDLLKDVHQLINITSGLPVRIGPVLFPISNPYFEMGRISLLNLISINVRVLLSSQRL